MATFKVTFKESYMPHEVERTCVVPSEKDVIDIYGLEEKDIEWYKIEEIGDTITQHLWTCSITLWILPQMVWHNSCNNTSHKP